MFIVISDSCMDCGCRGVGLFDSEPTKEEIKNIEERIGGMFCIVSKIYCMEIGEIKEETP